MTNGNESGSALLQVVFIGIVVGIMAYIGAQMMTKNDASNLRLVRRNENITFSILLSDQISDRNLVKNSGTIPFRDSTGPILYP